MDFDDNDGIYMAPTTNEKLADFNKIIATFDLKSSKAPPPVKPKKKTSPIHSPSNNCPPGIPLKTKNIPNNATAGNHHISRNQRIQDKNNNLSNFQADNKRPDVLDLPTRTTTKNALNDHKSLTLNSTTNNINKFGHPITPVNKSTVLAPVLGATYTRTSKDLPKIVTINGKTYRKIVFDKNVYLHQKCPKRPFKKPINIDLSKFKISQKTDNFITKLPTVNQEALNYDEEDYEDCDEFYSDIK